MKRFTALFCQVIVVMLVLGIANSQIQAEGTKSSKGLTDQSQSASAVVKCYTFEGLFKAGEIIGPRGYTDYVDRAYKLFELNPRAFHIKNPRKELLYKSGFCGCAGCSYTFKQVHNGLEIINSNIRVHGLAVSGTYCSNIKLSTTPKIDSASAFSLALGDLSLTELDRMYSYKQFPSWLCIWRDQDDRFHLIWIVWVIYEFLPDRLWEFYVDAREGKVLNKTEYVGSKSNALKPGVYGDVDPSALRLPAELTESPWNKIKTEDQNTAKSRLNSETAKCYSFEGPVRPNEMVQPPEASSEEMAYQLFELNPDRFHMKNPRGDLIVKGVHSGDFGQTVAFKQVYQGVDLLNSNISVTFARNGTVMALGGNYCSNLSLSAAPQIDSSSALTQALNQLGFPQELRQGYTANAIPSQLAIWRDDEGVFHLIWVVWLRYVESLPDDFWEVYLDAHDGSVLYKAHYRCQKESSM